MTVRANRNKKGLRPKSDERVASLLGVAANLESKLRFWTAHPTKPCYVDLNALYAGSDKSIEKKKGAVRPFTGRPELILEMAPYIQEHVAYLAKKSVALLIASLRAWWRLFDSIEKISARGRRLLSTADLTDFHRQYAIDNEMEHSVFGGFVQIANKTREGLGLGNLYWPAPEIIRRNQHLPPLEHFDVVRHELKRRWFETLQRWNAIDRLCASSGPLSPEECFGLSVQQQKSLLGRYRQWDVTTAATGKLHPTLEEIKASTKSAEGWDTYAYSELIRGRYPTGDIRTAFHLCLAATGWNPAVLLSLDINVPFLHPHPTDNNRYILRGVKDRAGGEGIVHVGLMKSQAGAGFILTELMARTAPLRKELQADLKRAKNELKDAGAGSSAYDCLIKKIHQLETKLRSPWLYVPTHRGGYSYLSDNDYFGHSSNFLPSLILDINKKRTPNNKISSISATQFRDALAARSYVGGGGFLQVNRLLGHKKLESTVTYLDNSLIREQHAKKMEKFCFALWDEVDSSRGVDPTILAYRVQFGSVPEEQRNRLVDYRKLLRSRIGVGCKDPYNPPKKISPNFNANGKNTCYVQRCMLCLDHAVIFPESMSGICMRMAELRNIRANMGLEAFTISRFAEELDNCETAIQAFDAREVREQLDLWTARIDSGNHRIAEFDGGA